jgi:hypothetical protein
MNISLSCEGGFWNGPPMGMCTGTHMPALPACARGRLLTLTDAPMKGT